MSSGVSFSSITNVLRAERINDPIVNTQTLTAPQPATKRPSRRAKDRF
jgi:hypothetical protein